MVNRWFGLRCSPSPLAEQVAVGSTAADTWGRLALVILALILPASHTGCSRLTVAKRSVYSTVPDEPNDDAERAKKLNSEGLAKLAHGKLDAAESLFRDALAADVDYAPAHNNLGQIYLRRRQLYLAAWEFEFASNLMPERPECLVNLGLVYETANRLLDARGAYEAALSIAPGDVEALSNLARVSVKLDDDPGRIHFLLGEVVMRDSRPVWRKWAQNLLATKYQLGGVSPAFSEPVLQEASGLPAPADGTTPVTPGLQLPIPRVDGQEPEEMVPAPVEVVPEAGVRDGEVGFHLSSPDSSTSSAPIVRTIDLSASELLPNLPAPSADSTQSALPRNR